MADAAEVRADDNDPGNRYRQVRARSEQLCATLHPDDYNLQAMANASPPKWHLGHTSWFFETFILKPFAHGWRDYHPRFAVLFNSYYNGIGEQYPRAQRGQLSRPTIAEVYAYRAAIDRAMDELLADHGHTDAATIRARTALGLHHEQQHQELLLTDIKYSLHVNPLLPAFHQPAAVAGAPPPPPLAFEGFAGGPVFIGSDGDDDFAFDNEGPRHRVLLEAYSLASRLVTNAEYLGFVEDGGYRDPALWLSDGWAAVRENGWETPLYWHRIDGGWHEYTLHGLQPLDGDQPVTHVSYYEADAFARWCGKRLPTEFEWEHAARTLPINGNFADNDRFHPAVCPHADGAVQQLFGDCWEWTASAYLPYPRYRPTAGAIGEYNGKFMCNQMVLRGGSCASATSHLRASYRNFFYPADRWQFSGIRLADDL